MFRQVFMFRKLLLASILVSLIITVLLAVGAWMWLNPASFWQKLILLILTVVGGFVIFVLVTMFMLFVVIPMFIKRKFKQIAKNIDWGKPGEESASVKKTKKKLK